MKDLFTKEQIKKSFYKLQAKLSDKNVSDGILFQPFCNTDVTQDFTRKDMKRINVFGTNFKKCKFIGVAATGSKFSNVYFQNCDFTGSNFQYCYFNKVNFKDSSFIKGANFSHSVFIGCSFSEISITESTLYDCYFENCSFADSTIRTNTLENSSMFNCLIRNIDLAHINLDYIRLSNVKMDKVVLPPYQVPYMLGATVYLKRTKDNVYIYTDAGNISNQEYCDMFDDLAAYFFAEKNYFPLANILIAEGKHSEAFDFIRLGIEESCDYFDFRMIKHFCKLACSNEFFSHNQLKILYDLVTSLSYNNSWDLNTLHSYMLNIGEIKELLLNNSENKQRVEFVVKTNIDKDDLTSINLLYNQINTVIKDICSNNHIDSIELRHNSPYELYITCIDALPNVLLFVSTMYSLFVVGSKGLDFLQKIEETVRAHQQNKLFKYELEEKQLDIELKKEELKKTKDKSNINTYSVVELEHILKCSSIDVAKKIDPEYLHYKISNKNKCYYV